MFRHCVRILHPHARSFSKPIESAHLMYIYQQSLFDECAYTPETTAEHFINIGFAYLTFDKDPERKTAARYFDDAEKALAITNVGSINNITACADAINCNRNNKS